MNQPIRLFFVATLFFVMGVLIANSAPQHHELQVGNQALIETSEFWKKKATQHYKNLQECRNSYRVQRQEFAVKAAVFVLEDGTGDPL